MNIRRLASYIVVAVLAAALWSVWVKEHPNQSPAQATQSSAATGQTTAGAHSFSPNTFDPTASKTNAVSAVQNSPVKATTDQANLISVKTDVLDVKIDPHGGNIVSAQLLKYPVSVQEKNTPMQILSNQAETLYVAQSGLTNTDAKGNTAEIEFSSEQNAYVMPAGVKNFVVSLTGKTANGLLVTKKYIFSPQSYAVQLSYDIKNTASRSWNGSLYTQLTRRKLSTKSGMFYARSYEGASTSSPQTPYEKLTYSDMDKANLSRNNAGGWVAMQQHYFLSAWVPQAQSQINHFYSNASKSPMFGDLYTVGFVSPQTTLAPNANGSVNATLYVGPEIAKNLSALAPGLDRTIDFGWLFWISVAIFWLMSLIHSILGNWGWAIVVTTILIKFILYPLSATSFRSMTRMRELQPKMQQLKERFGDDRQAMSRATMELYRKEGINPVGGCLPMLIQIPVFIALYYVIIESVQLRQAPFILWIHDLAVKDPYYVLPILMGLSMVLQQRITPSSPDPAQAKMMMFVPVVFTVFFLNFPAGLTLYWLVNNCVQMLQQWYVNKTYDAHRSKKAARKKKSKFKASLK